MTARMPSERVTLRWCVCLCPQASSMPLADGRDLVMAAGALFQADGSGAVQEVVDHVRYAAPGFGRTAVVRRRD